MLFATSTVSVSTTEYFLSTSTLDILNFNYQFFLFLLGIIIFLLIIQVIQEIYDR